MKFKFISPREIAEQFRLLGNFFSLVYSRFREERCFQLCGSLTFTTLLALVPLVTIALTVMTAFPVFADVSSNLREFVLSNLVPQAESRAVKTYVQQFSENAGRLTAAGVTLLGVAAIVEAACGREIVALEAIGQRRLEGGFRDGPAASRRAVGHVS